MSLAQIMELPRTEAEWAQWSFAHASFHNDVNQTIARTFSVTLPDYILDPFNPTDGSWIENHQISHDARNKVLGIQGYDLTTLDLSDESSVIEWLNLHAA